MEEHARSAGAGAARSTTVRALVVQIVFVLLAVVLWSGVWSFDSPVGPPADVPAWAADPATVRHPQLKPQMTIGTLTYQCNDCHGIFESPQETDRPLYQHEEVVLKHGINNRCFNCHHRKDRNAFADDRGEPIPYDQPQLVCAKCHGPVYRDWKQGVHGRTNGYWDTRRGPMERRRCTECHDPHVPPFPSMHPAPGPHTLRMGEQLPAEESAAETKNPLLIYRQALETRDPAEGEP